MPETDPQPPPTPTRRWKRTAAAALLLLVGGAIVNVAVAWGCVFAQPPLPKCGGTLAKEHSIALFVCPIDWQTLASLRDPVPSHYRVQKLSSPRTSRSSNDTWHAAIGVEAGWPLRAFQGVSTGTYHKDEGISSRGEWAVVLATDMGGPRILPLRPMWGGFFLNTYLFALHIWILLAGSCFLRRTFRRRRGLCETCAYPIGVSAVCTECGAAVSRNEPRA